MNAKIKYQNAEWRRVVAAERQLGNFDF